MDDNTIEIALGIAMAILSFLYSKFTKRQQTNKENIAQLEKRVETTDKEVLTVKTDLRDEVLGEILEAKREMEAVANKLGAEVTVLRGEVANLKEKLKTAEGENSKLRLSIEQQAETYRAQLSAKESELAQTKADLKNVTTQLDGALKDFVEQNKQHASDILELKTEMALAQAQIKGYQAVFELAMASKLMPVTPQPDAPKPDEGGSLPLAS